MNINLKDIKIVYCGQPKIIYNQFNYIYTQKVIGLSHDKGCAKCHFNSIIEALKIDGPVLLLQDDAYKTQWFNYQIKDIPEDADILYLGYSTYHGTMQNQIIDDNYSKLTRGIGATHAILFLTQKGKQKWRQHCEWHSNLGGHIDQAQWVLKNRCNVYLTNQPSFCQGPENNWNYKNTNVVIFQNKIKDIKSENRFISDDFQELRKKSKQITKAIQTKAWISFGSIVDDYHLYYQPISFMWNKFGYKTFYTLICDQNSIQQNQYGIILRLKKIQKQKIRDNHYNRQYVWQAQISRLYASSFIYGIMVTSDSDSMPLQEEYFNQLIKNTKEDNISISRKDPYGGNHYYCMMWSAANGNTFQKTFKSDCSFQVFCKAYIDKYGYGFTNDQKFLTQAIKSSGFNIKFMDYKNLNRICRLNWNYDKDKLKNGEYTDSHLLRPFQKNKIEILKLIKDRFI